MSGRVPPELFKKIQRKSQLKRSAVYNALAKKRQEYRGLISERAAAVLVASDLNITSAFRYLDDDDKEAISRLGNPQAAAETQTRTRVVQKEKSVAIDSLPGIKAFELFLPPELIGEATRMAERCYPLLYVYENTIRNVIKVIMEKKYGPDWWDVRVKKLHGKMDEKILSRIKDEADERWHSSKRGVHKIYYCDLDDLRKIIEDDWDVFKKIHPRKSWVTEHIMQPGHSRNIIAHNNPLSNKDIASIQTKVGEWLDQIKGIKLS